MCRFKESYIKSLGDLPKFQYILCVGSSTSIFKQVCIIPSFNTSYVSVQDAAKMIAYGQVESFNTSYVSVQAVVPIIWNGL